MKSPFYRNLPRDCWTPETETACSRLHRSESVRFQRTICPLIVLAAMVAAYFFVTTFFL